MNKINDGCNLFYNEETLMINIMNFGLFIYIIRCYIHNLSVKYFGDIVQGSCNVLNISFINF